MKKTLIYVLSFLFLATTLVFAEPEDETKKEPDKKQQCPKTLMTESCLVCHTTPSFNIRERATDEAYGLMPSAIKLVMDNDKIDSIYYSCEEVSPDDFYRIFSYLDQHKELPRKILIDVHNYGGSAFDAWKIVNMLVSKWKDYDITTRVDGMAFSAGFMIFNAGEHRICSEHAELMWHEAASWELFRKNTASMLKDSAEIYQHIQNNANSWLASRSKLSEKEINDEITVNREGWWLNGREAFEAGFCDELVGLK